MHRVRRDVRKPPKSPGSNRQYFLVFVASNRFLDETIIKKSFKYTSLTVTTVEIHILEYVQNRQNLAIVGHQGFTDHIAANDQMLQHLQCRTDDWSTSCIECIFNRNDLKSF